MRKALGTLSRNETGAELVAAARALERSVGRLRFARPVTHVYNPLSYARRAHTAYLER